MAALHCRPSGELHTILVKLTTREAARETPDQIRPQDWAAKLAVIALPPSHDTVTAKAGGVRRRRRPCGGRPQDTGRGAPVSSRPHISCSRGLRVRPMRAAARSPARRLEPTASIAECLSGDSPVCLGSDKVVLHFANGRFTSRCVTGARGGASGTTFMPAVMLDRRANR